LLTVDPGAPLAGVVPGADYAAGYLLYRRSGILFAQTFDADAFELRGEPVALANNVGEFSATDDVIVYRAAVAGVDGSVAAPLRRLVWVDRQGQRLGTLETPTPFRVPALSPDGRQVSVAVGPFDQTDLWTIDTERGVPTRLTFDRATDELSVWSPDSSRIVFNSGRGGAPAVPNSLFVKAADGTGSEERLLTGANDEILLPLDWSPDGRYLLFARAGISTWRERIDLWTLELTGERATAPLIESPFRKETAKLSPDARFIAYSSTEGGTHQIFVQPFPDVGRGRWPISTRGGREPRWRGDGAELYYMGPTGTLMAVDIGVDGDQLRPGAPRPLFELGFPWGPPEDAPDYYYAVTADGQRFLVSEPVNPPAASTPGEAAVPTTLNVIVNWTAGMAAR
jgi:dipeptidyl aminopeptidase/acylaminoacyl peptidase